MRYLVGLLVFLLLDLCISRGTYLVQNVVQLFRNQLMLDLIVDDIACMLEVPRRMLNVVATSKGCLVGDLTFTEADGNAINCRQAATVIIVYTFVLEVSAFHSLFALNYHECDQ